jgi:hypothetical protein
MTALRPKPLLAALSLAALLLTGCGDPSATGSGPTDPPGDGLVILNPGSPDRDYFHDFGEVPSGEVLTRVWELENTDPVPVTVKDLTASCSCTTPVISYVHESGELVRGRQHEKPVITIPPGAVARLEMRIDTAHVALKNIDKLAMVVLRCDSRNTPFVRFEAHLVATQIFQATPPLLDLREAPISTGDRGHSDLIPGVRGSGHRVLGVASTSPGLEAVVEEVPTAGEALWRIHVVLVPPLVEGLYEGEVVLRTSDEDGAGEGPPFVLPVRAQVVPDVVVRPAVLAFRGFGEPGGASAEGEVVALAPGRRVRIVDTLVQAEGAERIRVRVEPLQPDAEGRSPRWRVVLEAPDDLEPAVFSGRLQLTLADPDAPPVEVGFVHRRPE